MTEALITFGLTFAVLITLANTDTLDAEKLFSRRGKDNE